MAYQPIAHYRLIEGPPYSAYSQPRTDHPDGSYKIHLVKATEPVLAKDSTKPANSVD